MTESKQSVAQRGLAEAQKLQTYINSVKDVANTVVEQGLWIALSVDMFAISQKLYEDNNREHGTRFLFQQRKELLELLKWLTDKEISYGAIAKVPNPMAYIFRFMKPLRDELGLKGRDEGGVYYQKMDPAPAMILIFVFPGMLRLLAQQIGEIIPL